MSGEIYDRVRKKSVASTPEEKVRQSVLNHLLDKLHVPANLIGVEYSLSNTNPGNLKRIDIIVWTPDHSGDGGVAPWLLVECKKPGIALDEKLILQVTGYLSAYQSQYLWLTNGQENQTLKLQGDKYLSTDGIPRYGQGI